MIDTKKFDSWEYIFSNKMRPTGVPMGTKLGFFMDLSREWAVAFLHAKPGCSSDHVILHPVVQL